MFLITFIFFSYIPISHLQYFYLMLIYYKVAFIKKLSIPFSLDKQEKPNKMIISNLENLVFSFKFYIYFNILKI